MDLLGLSQALTLPHNPVQPNFAIIRLPRGTNVPAFYALLCQFGFADVKFSLTAEGWQDTVSLEGIPPQESQNEAPREETPPPAPSTVTTTTSPTISSLPHVLMRMESDMKAESSDTLPSQQTSPVTPGGDLLPSAAELETDERGPSTSVEEIVKSMLQIRREQSTERVGRVVGERKERSNSSGGSGFTRCEKCTRLLSTTSGSLISHAINHYPVKRFGCSSCGAQFFKKSMYNDHFKNMHPDESMTNAIDLRTERPTDGQDPIRNEWRRVAIECFPNHAHLFKYVYK